MQYDNYKLDSNEENLIEWGKCPQCDGSGYEFDGRYEEKVCSRCEGTGEAALNDPDYDNN